MYHLHLDEMCDRRACPDLWCHYCHHQKQTVGKFSCKTVFILCIYLSFLDKNISCENALIWMSLDFTDDQSTLVQVMAWCRQATSHYLSQCWPRSLSPYGVTRPQWIDYSTSSDCQGHRYHDNSIHCHVTVVTKMSLLLPICHCCCQKERR